ncbi:hypothetical protein [Rossellomorea sp. BNER]|uniref:hypothetical protein n=1 Tax=Rossellomorea sp. BNER TaxID=2962031 RepID=UPI003AF2C743|nr:hypothetical protein [Rossellomorea sp. BNER]
MKIKTPSFRMVSTKRAAFCFYHFSLASWDMREISHHDVTGSVLKAKSQLAFESAVK